MTALTIAPCRVGYGTVDPARVVISLALCMAASLANVGVGSRAVYGVGFGAREASSWALIGRVSGSYRKSIGLLFVGMILLNRLKAARRPPPAAPPHGGWLGGAGARQPLWGRPFSVAVPTWGRAAAGAGPQTRQPCREFFFF